MPVSSCGRSLYIDWRMAVMVGGEYPTPCKRGELSGRGICPRANMSREYVPHSLKHLQSRVYGFLISSLFAAAKSG